jgi:hypothetical protein
MSTVLSKYARLESTGLWRETPSAQRREVFVSMGTATLIVHDKNDTALAHWSLPAITRLNVGKRPAVFSPAEDVEETLEIEDNEMIDAIEKVRKTIARSKPRPGRLRWIIRSALVGTIVALALFWLPNALIRYTVSVVPEVTRVSIGDAVQRRIERVAGRPCNDALGRAALDSLRTRLGLTPRLSVVRDGISKTAHLPGDILLISRTLVEDFEDPDVVAGYLLVEDQRRLQQDPLEALLNFAGFRAALGLLTTGHLEDETLSRYTEYLLSQSPDEIDDSVILARFSAVGIPTTAYAYAEDITGENTLALIEGDTLAGTNSSIVLTDGQWISLQNICGG